MSRLKEIEQRKKEIKFCIGEPVEGETTEQVEPKDLTLDELKALEEELNALIEEEQGLKEEETEKEETRSRIAAGTEGVVVRKIEKESEKPMDMTIEYRNAWLNKLRGVPMTETQERAYSNAQNAGAEVIPEQVAEEIMTKIKKKAPMLDKVTLLHVNGAVRYAVEGTNNAAGIHSENGALNGSADTLTEVQLSGYEIAKLVQVSAAVRSMSIGTFESWLTDNLAEAIARKIEDLIINGTGSSQPSGLNVANSWGNTNSVTVAANASLTAANVLTLCGLLPAGYDPNAAIVMSKKTLFTDFLPLQDASKHDLVKNVDGEFYVYGYKVLLSDYVAYHEAFLGDFSKVVANLAEDINVRSAYDIDTNSYKYAGVAVFDCKTGIGEAIVKLVKGS